MAFPSSAVARQILNVASAESRPLTPLELIKLTYLAHGWSLALRDKPLVGEPVQAWQYGPVYPELYHALKSYRANPVTSVPPAGVEVFGHVELPNEEKQLISAVFNAYKGFNGVQLSSLTHQPGTPWFKAWSGAKNTVIDDGSIKAHFRDIVQRRKAAEAT